MVETTDNLRIENPCPFVPTFMNKDGENFFCKSCNKSVVDFRKKNIDEIKCSIDNDTCGIFTIEQLPGQQTMKFSRQLLFYFFSFLSFLGYTVGPLSAQTSQTNKDTVKVDAKSFSNDQEKVDKTQIKKSKYISRRKARLRMRKQNRDYLSGCPSF
jgi:hypothetical protein